MDMFRVGFSFTALAQGLFAKLPVLNYNAWILGATWVHCIARVGLLARQLKHVKRKLPELEHSLERPYTRDQAESLKQGSWLKLSIFRNLFTSTAVTAMVRFGLYHRLWILSSRYCTGSDSRWKGPISQQLTYYAILQAVIYLVELPATCWSEFIKNNWPARPRLVALWVGAGTVLDGIPSILLSSVKILPFLVASKWIDDDHLLAIGATGILLLPLIAWTFSSKLFLTAFPEYKNLEDGPVKEKIDDLARKVNFPVEKIYKSEPDLQEPEEAMNDVPRCVAFGSKVFVTIPQGLLEKCPDDEILAILAHEFGHWKHKHSTKSYLFTYGTLHIVLSVLLFKQDPNFFRSFGFPPDTMHSKGSAMIAWTLFERFGLSLMPFWMVARNQGKQRQEFQADAFATSLGLGHPLISFLKRNESRRLDIDLPDRWLNIMSSTHPLLASRVKAIEQQIGRFEKTS